MLITQLHDLNHRQEISTAPGCWQESIKVQVEFNTANVEAYRLIGYENRLLNQEDFEDDTEYDFQSEFRRIVERAKGL